MKKVATITNRRDDEINEKKTHQRPNINKKAILYGKNSYNYKTSYFNRLFSIKLAVKAHSFVKWNYILSSSPSNR